MAPDDVPSYAMRLATRHVVAVAIVAVTTLAAFACGNTPSTPAPAAPDPVREAHIHGGPPPPPAPLRDGERFLEVGLTQAFKPSPPSGGTDEYRCFLIDPKLTERSFITGTQFLPQNLEIVHHAILYSVKPSEVAHAKEVDNASPGDGWQCFGGTGLNTSFLNSGDTYLGGWAPGGKETLVGAIAGYPVDPGTQVVLQVHYNLLSTSGKSGPTDQSSMRLRLMPGTADVTPLEALRIIAPIELPCTASESGPLCDRTKAVEDLVARTGPGARTMVNQLNQFCNKGNPPVGGVTQHCDVPVREAALVYSVAPHMHLLGRSISVELNPGKPDARMLLDQKAFNFDDQTQQPLAQPVRLNPGDVLRVTCTHDASLRAQLPELKVLQPRYVVWGDGTSDEMCLATLITTPKV